MTRLSQMGDFTPVWRAFNSPKGNRRDQLPFYNQSKSALVTVNNAHKL
jgi:hypothetical protein